MYKLANAKISSGRLSLATLLRLRVLLGHYCPVSPRVTLRLFSWIYCLLLPYLLCIYTTKYMASRGAPIFPVLSLMIEYWANAILSLLSEQTHFFELLKGVELIDREMGFDHLPLIMPATGYIFSVIIVHKAWNCFSNFVLFGHGIYFASFTNIMTMASALNCLLSSLPLDLLRLRIKLLRQALTSNLSLSINNTEDKIKILWDTFRLYRKLTDNVIGGFHWTKLQIFISTCCCFFSFVINGYYICLRKKHSTDAEYGIADCAWDIFWYVLFAAPSCLPAVFCELASREVDKLKSALGELLLLCEDDELQSELQLAIEYMDHLPFRETIFQVWSLDGCFILAFGGLCTTYLITIVQIFGII
ncbi:uncharacterized protein LOC134672653 [Cydia fagiglandana]|uniref:uncharacterized protein LOC134672653 n=1 Tax=Cydia fagiglandana TaxID=1458189 RepID=UPI002FEDE798